jgi:hypothetical protein
MSSKRAGSVASAIVMLIAAALVLIMGIVYTVEGLWWEDFWVALGVFCFLSFSMAIVGTIAIARRAWRFSVLLADGMLVACGGFSLVDFTELGIIIVVLSAIALVLIGVSWGQFKEQHALRYPYTPMMQPPAPGMPGPAVGMVRPGSGTAGPVRGVPPPGATGAPPPGAVPPMGGAPPPRSDPAEDEGPVVRQVIHR